MKISKEKMLTVVLPLAIAAVLVILMAVNLFGGVKQTKDSIVHEAGKELNIDVTDFFDVNEEAAGNITVDTSEVDTETVGVYTATAKYKMHTYQIQVDVQDTQAPSVEFAIRYVFTNNVAEADLAGMVAGAYDASEYTLKLVRFEKSGMLNVMTESALKDLTDAIPVPCSQEELAVMGTEEIPTEEGIYRAVLSATDTYGNVCYEEVYVILDTTGARIEDVPDKEVSVPSEKLAEAPVVNPGDYVIKDNVDGSIPEEDIVCELELRDEAAHEWLVHVSYTDRAGNESKAEFLIVVKEGTDAPDEGSDTPDEGTENPDTGNDTPDTGNENPGTETTYTYKNLNKTMYAVSGVNVRDLPASDGEKLGKLATGDAVTVTGQCNETKWYRIDYNGKTGYVSSNYLTDTKPEEEDDTEYHPADTNKDGEVDDQEREDYITPIQWEIINAGYHNVIQCSDGSYAVLMHMNDEINGFDLLEEYLKKLDLEPVVETAHGGIIDADNDWYCWYVDKVQELIGPDDPEYWEHNDWYDDEETGMTYFSYEDYMKKQNGVPYK